MINQKELDEYFTSNYSFNNEEGSGIGKFRSSTARYFRKFDEYEIWVDRESNYWGGATSVKVILLNPIPANNAIFHYPSLEWYNATRVDIREIEAKVAKILPHLKECMVEVT